MTTADDPMDIDFALLKQLAEIAEPHHNALLADIRAAFGDERAPTLHTVALSMLLGTVLKMVRNSDRAPAGVAVVWSLMRVPFTLENQRVQ